MVSFYWAVTVKKSRYVPLLLRLRDPQFGSRTLADFCSPVVGWPWPAAIKMELDGETPLPRPFPRLSFRGTPALVPGAPRPSLAPVLAGLSLSIYFFYLTHFARSYTRFLSHAPSIAEGLSCALWSGGWSRPEPAASGMRQPCFSSQRPSCQRLGTHTRHNSRPDQKVVKIKTFGATTGDGLQQRLIFVLRFSCGRSPPVLWGQMYIHPCFTPGKAMALGKWGMAICQTSDSARIKIQIWGAPQLYVYYLLTHGRCSSERMEDDPCAGRPGLLGVWLGIIAGMEVKVSFAFWWDDCKLCARTGHIHQN